MATSTMSKMAVRWDVLHLSRLHAWYVQWVYSMQHHVQVSEILKTGL